VKKILTAVSGGSIVVFVALFLKVAHFGRNQVLFGNPADVSTADSAMLFAVIRFIYSFLHTGAVLLRDHGILLAVGAIVAGAAAIFLSRPHQLDAAFLTAIIAVSFASFAFLTAPWLFVSNVIQDRGLHPAEVLRGNDRLSVAARENWSCLVCASVKETRIRQMACPAGHEPDACAGHVQRGFALVGVATLLLVGALAYVTLARGNWIDKASPGSGFAKATLTALSYVCVVLVALNVYAVGYVYGKTVQGFELEKVRQVSSDFTSDPLFAIARTSSAATLLFGIGDLRPVELGNGLRLEPAGTANVLSEVMTGLAEAELAASEDAAFFRSAP